MNALLCVPYCHEKTCYLGLDTNQLARFTPIPAQLGKLSLWQWNGKREQKKKKQIELCYSALSKRESRHNWDVQIPQECGLLVSFGAIANQSKEKCRQGNQKTQCAKYSLRQVPVLRKCRPL